MWRPTIADRPVERRTKFPLHGLRPKLSCSGSPSRCAAGLGSFGFRPVLFSLHSEGFSPSVSAFIVLLRLSLVAVTPPSAPLEPSPPCSCPHSILGTNHRTLRILSAAGVCWNNAPIVRYAQITRHIQNNASSKFIHKYHGTHSFAGFSSRSPILQTVGIFTSPPSRTEKPEKDRKIKKEISRKYDEYTYTEHRAHSK